MHRDVRRGYTVQGGGVGGKLRYQRLLVPAPRCSVCRSAHRRATLLAKAGHWFGGALGFVIAIVLIVASQVNLPALLLAVAAVSAGIYLGGKAARALAERRSQVKGIHPWHSGDAYPPVAAQLQSGRRSGKPFGVS